MKIIFMILSLLLCSNNCLANLKEYVRAKYNISNVNVSRYNIEAVYYQKDNLYSVGVLVNNSYVIKPVRKHKGETKIFVDKDIKNMYVECYYHIAHFILYNEETCFIYVKDITDIKPN